MRFLILISFFCCSFALNAYDETELHQTELRIRPLGTVSLKTHAEKKTGFKRSKKGKEVYEHHCVVCHSAGLAGAPRFRREEDWMPRLRDRTLDDLVTSSIKGLNAMPTKGTCIKCTEEDLKAAISYMLPKS